jgi:hypothetical protein
MSSIQRAGSVTVFAHCAAGESAERDTAESSRPGIVAVVLRATAVTAGAADVAAALLGVTWRRDSTRCR